MTETIEIPARADAIADHKQAGGKVCAVFPIHYPRALLRAHGLLPVEVWGPPGQETTSGDAHLQAYTCSIVRCGLAFIHAGGLDVADAILVPHACDSLQGLGSLLLDFDPPGKPVLTVYMPRGRRDSDAAFLAAELRGLGERLAEISGKRPTDAELLAAVEREERADAALAELLDARPGLPMGNRDFYELVRAREYLPAEVFEPAARAALATVEQGAGSGKRVVLSGLVPEPMALLDALDDVDVMVAADDMACAGRRAYRAGRASDPALRLAEGLLSGPPDSVLGCPVEDRLAHLLTLARRSGARGVIHFDIKFCEPEQFYLPQLNTGLATAGLKTLGLEVDLADPLPDQVVTRLEAFAETIP